MSPGDLEGASFANLEDFGDEVAWKEPGAFPSGVCPHCLTINFAQAQTCRECHASLVPGAAPAGAAMAAQADQPFGADPPEPAAWPTSPAAAGASDAGLIAELQAPRPCPRCGLPESAGASFCSACGAALDPGALRFRVLAGIARRLGAMLVGVLMGALVVVAFVALQPRLTTSRQLVAASPPPAPRAAGAPAARTPAPVTVLRPPIPALAGAPVQAALPASAQSAPAQPRLRQAPAPARAREHAARTPAPPRIYNVVWESEASASEVQRAYPADARQAGIAGSAAVECVIAPDGRLHACSVVSETPAGHGFGRAALKLAPAFRAGSATASGWPTAGYRTRIPLKWSPSP
jgi:protein TonB